MENTINEAAERDLLDTDGENRALRSFLMQYGVPSLTVSAMRKHMERSGWGFDYCPDFAKFGGVEHLTKAGAQIWIRHLLSLESGAILPQASGEAQRVPARSADELRHLLWSSTIAGCSVALNHIEAGQFLAALKAQPAPAPEMQASHGAVGKPPKYKLSDAERAALTDAAATGATFAEMDGGAIMFINRGEDYGHGAEDDQACPVCGGSGHKDDATPASDSAADARDAGLAVQGMSDCMDMVRGELIEAGIIDKSVPPMMVANAVLARLSVSERNAARYQWLLDNYARGDGHTDIDAALNDGEAEKYLSPAIDAQIAAIQAKEAA